MKISCEREKLLESFQIAESITPRKTSKPILKNVKIEAFDKNIQITATNIEMTMKKTLEVGSVGEEGAVLVSGKDVTDILRETDSQDIFIAEEDNSVIIKAGDANFTIQSNIAEEFFSVEDIKTEFEVTVNNKRLEEMINQTIFTTGKETMAYTFEGILFNVSKNLLEIVGTDGKRIAIASEQFSKKSKKEVPEKKFLVPIPTLRTLINILNISEDEEAVIQFSDNYIVFKDSTTELKSQLLEGRFPEYNKYIPEDYKIVSKFKKGELNSGIRKADIMTSQETHLITFNFNKDGLCLQMTSKCIDRGTSEVTIPMESYEGEDITVGFDGRHLLDVIRVVNEENVTWKIKEDQGPGEIIEGEKYKYVFMPVKLR
jgi:DNA polymerase-3 subunit beta